MNALQEMNEPEIELPRLKEPSMNPETFLLETQEEVLREIDEYREGRNLSILNQMLQELFLKTKGQGNLIREMIAAYKAKATIGEVMGVIREAMGYPYDVFKMVQRPSYLTYVS